MAKTNRNLGQTGDGRRKAAIFAALFLAMLPLGSPALASSFQVDPVGIELAPGHRTTSLSVKNTGSEAVSVRVRLYRWTQKDGEDVYSETEDLIASPPIFTIAPNETQLIRVGRRGQSLDAAYRVILEEIPRAAGDTNGIAVALRINLPFYAFAEVGGEAELGWSAWRNDKGQVVVEAQNRGSRHRQILELGSVDSEGRETTLSSQMGVVLPGGSRKRWNVGLRPDLPASPFALKVRDGSGEITLNQISLQQR